MRSEGPQALVIEHWMVPAGGKGEHQLNCHETKLFAPFS
jgi:hypothetical protein